jgi:hypothetical protein
MTTKTGAVTIQFSESRLNGQLLLRRNGTPTPAGAATNFLAGAGIGNGDFATITGTDGPSGAETAFFIQSAVKSQAPALVATAARIAPSPTPRKKPLQKKAAKKSSARKKGARKKTRT